MILFLSLVFALFSSAEENEVLFSNGNIQLSGTMLLPASKGQHSAIVFLHGSGPSDRSQYRAIAQHFTDAGYVSLIYDKRGTGKSKGSWIEASLEDLANDAAAAITFLKARPEVIPDSIGVWGVSQAGWIVPVLNSRQPFRFLIMVTGGGATPLDTEMYGYEMQWKQEGFTEAEKTKARKLSKQYFDYLRSGEKRTELLAAMEKAKSEKWYSSLSLDRILPSEENRKNWSWVAQYDPLPLIEQMKMPILLLFGGKDFQTPTELAVRRWEEGLKKAKNPDFTIRVFPEAAHAMTLGEHSAHGSFIPEYFETMLTWLKERRL